VYELFLGKYNTQTILQRPKINYTTMAYLGICHREGPDSFQKTEPRGTKLPTPPD